MAGAPQTDPEEPLYSGESLETADGPRVPRQQPVGPQAEGGGEFPDPDTQPRLPAPGAAEPAAEDDGAQGSEAAPQS